MATVFKQSVLDTEVPKHTISKRGRFWICAALRVFAPFCGYLRLVCAYFSSCPKRAKQAETGQRICALQCNAKDSELALRRGHAEVLKSVDTFRFLSISCAPKMSTRRTLGAATQKLVLPSQGRVAENCVLIGLNELFDGGLPRSRDPVGSQHA